MPAAQGVRHRCRQRLFDEGVLASTQRTRRDLCVAGWRRCADDGIDLVEDVANLMALLGDGGAVRGVAHPYAPNLPSLTRTVRPLVANR